MSVIDVSDLNLTDLILELWRNQRIPDCFQQLSFMAPYEPSKEEIELVLKKGYVEYIAGKYINTDFSNPTKVNTYSYNTEAGSNTFERVVSKFLMTIQD